MDSRECKQRSPEWFSVREKRITGSIAGALLGMSPYMSVGEAIAALKGERVVQDNHILAYGRAVEETAIGIFELETGLQVRQTGFHTFSDWLGASPDGLVVDDGEEVIGLVEIKCPWGLRNDDQPQFKPVAELPHYYSQMQLEMLCARLDCVYFFQYANGNHSLEIVTSDAPWLEKYLPKLRSIWEDTFQRVNPAQQLIDQYFDTVAELARLEADKKRLLDEIVLAAGELPGAIGDAKLTKSERAGSVSYAKVVKDHLPDLDLEPYRGKPSTYWALKR